MTIICIIVLQHQLRGFSTQLIVKNIWHKLNLRREGIS
jgi:hypothetical protein